MNITIYYVERQAAPGGARRGGVMARAGRQDLQEFKAEFFRALSHPLRIRILEVLRHGDRSVQELQSALRIGQAALSQHLAVLRTKNVVSTRKEGTTVRYSLRDPLLGDLLDIARRIFSNHLVGTQTLLRELRAERTPRR
jgi:DNA-binding transcriptional ArsR family regulator